MTPSLPSPHPRGRGVTVTEKAPTPTPRRPTFRSFTDRRLYGSAMRDANTPQSPVVVGIDGSQAAIQAAERAVDEAVSREAELRLIHVIHEQVEPATIVSVDNERMELEYGETALSMASAAVATTGKPVKVETAILRGDPHRHLSPIPRRRDGLCRLGGHRTLRSGVTGFHCRITRRGRPLPGRNHPHPAAAADA